MAVTHLARARLSGPAVWPRSAVVQVSRLALGSVAALSVALGLLVVWRRLSGVPGVGPPWPAGVFSGALAAAVAGALRAGWALEARRPASRTTKLLRRALPSLVPLSWGLAVSLPPASAPTLVGFWSLVVAEEIWGWGLAGRGWGRRASAPRKHLSGNRQPQTATSPTPVRTPGAPPPAVVEPSAEGEVLEQLTRCRLTDGTEQIAGWLAVHFAPGQRTDCLHVAFCPPFARSPELQITQLEGPLVRVKTGQLQPYGVRLDLKLAETAPEAERVVLSFAARAPA